MKTYYIESRQVVVKTYAVEAESIEDALSAKDAFANVVEQQILEDETLGVTLKDSGMARPLLDTQVVYLSKSNPKFTVPEGFTSLKLGAKLDNKVIEPMFVNNVVSGEVLELVTKQAFLWVSGENKEKYVLDHVILRNGQIFYIESEVA